MAQSGLKGAAVGAGVVMLLAGGGLLWFVNSAFHGPKTALASAPPVVSAPLKLEPKPADPPAAVVTTQPAAVGADVVFSRYSPGVVRVIARSGEFRVMQGSGFFVSRDGLLVTNHHVIKDAELISIVRDDNSTVFAEQVVADDAVADLAILKLNVSNVPCLVIGPDAPPKIGTKVYAIGNPDGLTNTLSEGLISGIRKGVKGLPGLQTSAPISHGSSGGPLLTDGGDVVGVTTAMMVDGQNLNFAVPASEVRKLLHRKSEPRKLATAGLAPLDSSETEAFGPVWAALDRGRYATASQLLAGLRQSQEKNPLYWFATGFLHARLRNTDLATDAYKTAIDLKPDFELAWYELGRCYQGARRWNDAFDAFKQAARIKPRNCRAYSAAGFVCNQMGDTNKALDFFDKAREFDPQDATPYAGTAMVYLGQRRFQDAVTMSQKAIALRPDYALAYLDLGICYQQMHRLEDARTAWQNAVRFDPDGPSGRVAVFFLKRVTR